MNSKRIAAIFIIALLIQAFLSMDLCRADNPFPEAPASVSWIPHGYGQTINVLNTPCSWAKGLHGFRSTPKHTGCWSQALWGWDVNGFYRGPQVAEPDPVDFQLPIGLVYPENNQRLGMVPNGRPHAGR
jgi:hypothetical protein